MSAFKRLKGQEKRRRVSEEAQEPTRDDDEKSQESVDEVEGEEPEE